MKGGDIISEIDYYDIGDRIRDLRNERGYSQFQMAEKADISSNYLSHIENGLANFSFGTFIKIVNALETTPNKLLYGVVNNYRNGKLETILYLMSNIDDADLDRIEIFIELIRKIK